MEKATPALISGWGVYFKFSIKVCFSRIPWYTLLALKSLDFNLKTFIENLYILQNNHLPLDIYKPQRKICYFFVFPSVTVWLRMTFSCF